MAIIWHDAGRQGRIRLRITWYDADGDSETTVHEVTLDASALAEGAVPSDGTAWDHPRVIASGLLLPEDIGDTEVLRRWSRMSHCDIEMYHVGGCRVLDAVLYEQPIALALEANDIDPVAHLYEPSVGAAGPSLFYPVEALDQAGSDGDPRGGTHRMLDVHHAAWERLCPALIQWSAYQERTTEDNLVHTFGSNSDDDTYAPACRYTQSSTLVRFPDEAAIGYDATEPGWSLASGAYSRRLAENEPIVMSRNGSIPVWARVRASSDIASTAGLFRVQASPYSYVDVSLAGLATFPQWYVVYGHLRCGAGPGDPSVAQAFWQRSSGLGQVRVHQVSVLRAGQWTPAGWTEVG